MEKDFKNTFSGFVSDYADALTGIYEFIAKDYVEDVYRDIMETYIISTIKVLNFHPLNPSNFNS